MLRRSIRLKTMRRALRVAACLALAPLVAGAASAQPAPSSPSKKSPSSGPPRPFRCTRSLREEHCRDPQARQSGVSRVLPRLRAARPRDARGTRSRLRGLCEAGRREVAGHARRGRPEARAGLLRHRLRHVSIQGALRRGRARRPLRAALREDAEGLEDHRDLGVRGSARHAPAAARLRRGDARRRDRRSARPRRGRPGARGKDRLRRTPTRPAASPKAWPSRG